MQTAAVNHQQHFKSKRQFKIWEKQQKENAAKRLNRALYANQSPFRYAERIYKSRMISDADAREIVDFSNLSNNTIQVQNNIVQVPLKHDLGTLSNAFGDMPHRSNYALVMRNVPGLIVIPNAFSPNAQRQLVKHCLRDYAKPPHTSNLDGHYHVPKDGIWPLYEQEKKGLVVPGDANYYIPSKTVPQDQDNMYPATIEDADDDALSVASSMYSDISGKSARAASSPTQMLKKQRWVTLGYQYHWGTKKYNLEDPIPIPSDISDLMKAVVKATEDIGCQDAEIPWKNQYRGADFKPEAGIINFYQLQSTLMGHVDQSEINMEAPLISMSLGHSCIYLIGGNTRDTKPIPLKLNSGDMLVMTAIARRAYHGVPRILENTLPDYMLPESVDDEDWKIFGDYMKTTRINLNIRQVFPK
ncbi:alpha-ketoglutarate-dependent dioxygenase alkb-like [Mucor ambiguus]|uniref:Alpha-ketoglutarate-dependent dioxygenase alkb-like n=1 Tax=Mucor ambiguus TaxID=91626 RepID=A0A0C9MUR4_9FUNG|nr:alpha-ketoglutarate-dependent dioxygenase alkb-like [Mucor ambiguus]